MKCSLIKLTLVAVAAAAAGSARLADVDDKVITTPEEAEGYTGYTLVEDNEKVKDLHILYRDGMACINYHDENGKRVNYDYPLHSIARIKHLG